MFDNDPRRGDELTARLLSGETSDEHIVMELLHEFHSGYSPANLKPLLGSRDTQVVHAGVWIASELGGDACTLLDDIVPLVRHSNAQVRFFALDVLTACAEPGKAQLLVVALDRIDDREPSVQWKALMFLVALSEQTVHALKLAAARSRGLDVHVRGLDLVCRVSGEDGAKLLSSAAAADDVILCRYAAVAAARRAQLDPESLKPLINSVDQTIRQFATDILERLSLPE